MCNLRFIGILPPHGTGLPDATPEIIITEKDFAVFQWRASAADFPKTDLVRVRCGHTADRNQIAVRLPPGWKDALNGESIRMAEARLSHEQMAIMGQISVTECLDEIMEVTNQRFKGNLMCRYSRLEVFFEFMFGITVDCFDRCIAYSVPCSFEGFQ